MTSRYNIKIVEGLVVDGVDAKEIEQLLDIAAYVIERISPTLARRVDFDLSDFANAKLRGVSGFMLTLTRNKPRVPETWTAEFRRENRSLSVLLSVAVPS